MAAADEGLIQKVRNVFTASHSYKVLQTLSIDTYQKYYLLIHMSFDQLPVDVLLEIFSFTRLNEILVFRLISKRCYQRSLALRLNLDLFTNRYRLRDSSVKKLAQIFPNIRGKFHCKWYSPWVKTTAVVVLVLFEISC